MPSENVVSIAGRKQEWTPEEAFAVAMREHEGDIARVSIVIDKISNGNTTIVSSHMNRRDMVWQAECLRHEAMVDL